MKRILVGLLVVCMLCALCACGDSNAMATDYMTVDGVYVDEDYRDEDNSALRLVYLFYTITPQDTNMKVCSSDIDLIANESNTYDSEHYPGVCKYAPNYYYSRYLEEVFTGTTLKVVATYKVPEAELKEGNIFTLADDEMPEIDKIKIKSEDIVHLNGVEAVCEAADPEGYAAEMEKREDADAATVAKVEESINGYYWSFYVNSTSYEMEFDSGNYFELRTRFGTNSGTYEVKKGYLFCTYPSNNHTVEVPYSYEGDKIKLDLTTAFDVNQN